MTRSRRSQWRRTIVIISVAALVAVFCFGAGYVLWGLVVLLAALPLAWISSPWHVVPSVSHWEAQARHVRENSVIIYWRPGCPACLRLRFALGPQMSRVSMVDIWDDDAAAAFVRDVNGGSETVPTVILGNGDVVVNPPAQTVALELSVASAASSDPAASSGPAASPRSPGDR